MEFSLVALGDRAWPKSVLHPLYLGASGAESLVDDFCSELGLAAGAGDALFRADSQLQPDRATFAGAGGMGGVPAVPPCHGAVLVVLVWRMDFWIFHL